MLSPMRRAALVTVLCFGCATGRPPTVGPLPLLGAPPARVALAEPTLELWMEGTHAPSEVESAEALERSRTALARALEGRGGVVVDGTDEPDALLAIHARAVARTGERRSAQIGSVVAGVIAFVAVVVVVIVLSTRNGGKSHGTGAFPAPARVAPAPGPWRGPAYQPAAPPPFFFGWAVGLQIDVPLAPAGPPAAAVDPPAASAPEPDPLLDARGWLDGDEVELVAELVDPRTSQTRWRRALRETVDPRDERAMRRLVDRLLDHMPLAPRGVGAEQPPRPSPDASPEPVERAPEGNL
jgi:hypothetical protein